MTREEAVAAVKTLMKKFGVESPGLNTKGLGGAVMGRAQIYFEYQEEKNRLVCHALVFKFPAEPEQALLDRFAEEEASGTNTGGGQVTHLPDDRVLVLSRVYDEPVDDERFLQDSVQLGEASLEWRAEVFPRVVEEFNREESE